MRLSVGSDERNYVTDWMLEELRTRGMEVDLHGALKPGADSRWPEVARSVAEDVTGGRCEQGILFCWTDTGVSMAANKVPGIRAALCTDGVTAKGARLWNDANVLCMSLRLASQEVVREILDALVRDNGDR